MQLDLRPKAFLRLTDSLNYTLGLYASSWAEDANAVIYTIVGLLDEKNELRIYV